MDALTIDTVKMKYRRARAIPGRTAELLDGYKPMTEHDWPERRQYEALAMLDACDGAPPEDGLRLFH